MTPPDWVTVTVGGAGFVSFCVGAAVLADWVERYERHRERLLRAQQRQRGTSIVDPVPLYDEQLPFG